MILFWGGGAFPEASSAAGETGDGMLVRACTVQQAAMDACQKQEASRPLLPQPLTLMATRHQHAAPLTAAAADGRASAGGGVC